METKSFSSRCGVNVTQVWVEMDSIAFRIVVCSLSAELGKSRNILRKEMQILGEFYDN